MIRNSNGFQLTLNNISEKANQMFKNNAYIYQYQKYGLEYNDFIESLADFEKIIANYE